MSAASLFNSSVLVGGKSGATAQLRPRLGYNLGLGVPRWTLGRRRAGSCLSSDVCGLLLHFSMHYKGFAWLWTGRFLGSVSRTVEQRGEARVGVKDTEEGGTRCWQASGVG